MSASPSSRWLPVLWLAIFASCFGLSLGDEPFFCGEGGLCPTGYECTFDVCTRIGKPDGATPDVITVIDATCAPDDFIECVDGTRAKVCNGEGTGILEVDCPGGCNAAEELCVRCTPNAVTCADDTRIVCGPKGDVVMSQTCHAGCDPSPPAVCFQLVPSNLPADACDADDESDDVVIDQALQMDTSNCASLGGQVLVQENGGGSDSISLCFVRVRRFTVDQEASLRVVGTMPLAILATERIDVRGRIDVSADLGTPGPGGQASPGPGQPGGQSNNGGGGAGLSTLGGNGGLGGTSGGAAGRPGGGAIYGNDELVPLIGGSYGGVGGIPCVSAPCLEPPASDHGGGGGGGLQLVACESLTVGQESRLNAGGGGGPPGIAGPSAGGGDAGVISVSGGTGGGAGGSGGAILLEAPQLFFPNGSRVTANGGGGGGGASASTDGSPGGNSDDEVPGIGGGAPLAAGRGGTGGALTGPNEGENARQASASAGGGGGGGAAGRIRLNARPDKTILVSPGARVVPTPSKGSIARRRDE
jgi:hypothetical protein